MLKNSAEKSRFSRPITRIAVASVALGVCVMILAVSIVQGFQYEIRDKVIGFGSHIQINHRTTNNSFESLPVDIAPDFLVDVLGQPGVKHIQPYAIKPAIMQVRRKTEDTTRKNENEILGVICKGVNQDYDWTFFNSNMVEGESLDFSKNANPNEIVISKSIAGKLKVNLHDSVYLFMVVAEGPKPHKFFIRGIYETGLADFDDQFVFINIYHIQKINDWGVEGFAGLEVKDNQIKIQAVVNGSKEHLLFRWNDREPTGESSIVLPLQSQKLTYVVYDNKRDADQHGWVPKFPADTVRIDLLYEKVALSDTVSKDDLPLTEELNDTATVYHYADFQITLTKSNSGGTFKYTAGGFEVLLNEWKDLENADVLLSDVIPYDYETRAITSVYPEIFDWLILLDTNVRIIILLMLLVCLVNMASTLLVIILERTSQIGIMKALGSSNISISKIFVYNAAYYILSGLIIGNILAIGIGVLQQQTGFLTLDQETYFMNTVPVHLNVWYLLAIDLGTLIICTLAMLLPSMIIVKISPVKAIHFK